MRVSAGYLNLSTSLWELGEDGKDAHQLLKGWRDPPYECCGAWTADGKYFVFETYRLDGLNNIRRIDDAMTGLSAGVAPDGSLLLTRDIGTQEIYALNVKWP